MVIFYFFSNFIGYEDNFVSKDCCFKCQEKKPENVAYHIPEAKPSKDHKWKCEGCQFDGNFPSKTECFKC